MYDANGQPKAVPTYCIGKNNAYCVNAKGKYDIVEFLTDHCKDFKYLYNVNVGQLAPHIKMKYTVSLYSFRLAISCTQIV